MASNLVKRSVVLFRPTAVSASRVLSIINAGHRSYSSMPTDDFYTKSPPRMLWPEISSMSINIRFDRDERKLSLKMTGSEESDDGLSVSLKIKSGLKKEDMRLPEKTSSYIKEEMNDEMLKVTLPKKDEFNTNIMANIIANDIITSFRSITTKCGWPYYEMFFDRSILVKRFCSVIAMQSPINSFSLNKRNGTRIDINMPGLQKIKLTTQGLRVSLKMHGLKREDIKTFLGYDTFFIEGKTKTEHYITCIHLPEGMKRRHNMIKKQMQYGAFNAVIACVKKDEIKIY